MNSICAWGLLCLSIPCAEPGRRNEVIRVATFNLEDVRNGDLASADNPRLRHAAAPIQRIAPDILLINEMAYDQPGSPAYVAGAPEGRNGLRFAELYLAVSQAEGLAPIRYQVFMAPCNTGRPSHFDLDRNGRVVDQPSASSADGDAVSAKERATRERE